MATRTRRVHLGLLGFGVVLYLWGFVGQTLLAALPPGTGERLDSYPVVFGGVEAGSFEEVRFLAEGHPPGSRVALVSSSGKTETLVLPNAYSVPYLLVTLLSGILFLWISGFLIGPRADNPALRDLMIGTWAYGLAVMIGGVYYPKTPWTPDLIRGTLQLALLAFLPVVFLHIACVFPRPMPGLRRFSWIFAILGGAAVILVVWQESAFVGYFRNPGPEAFSDLAAPQAVADTLLVAQVALGLLVLGGRALTEKERRERSLLKWILAGFAVGLTPYVFLRTLPGVLGLDFRLPAACDRVFEMAIPLAVVFVIVRNRFLDIDVVVRRGLLYSAVALIALLVAVLAAVLVGLGLDPTLRSWHWLPVLGLGMVAGVLFTPVREWMGRWIDRTLFHIHHDVLRVLEPLDQGLDESRDQRELAVTACFFLHDTLALDRAGLILLDGEERLVETRPGIRIPDPVVTDALSVLEGQVQGALVAAPGSTDSRGIEDPLYPESLSQNGFPLSAPLRAGADRAGLLLVGRKRSGRHLVGPDLQVVTGAVARLEFALARMRLVQEAERAQIKDRFFSRVAHDLRTPLTSIGWTVRNLADGVAGDLTPAQRDYVEGLRTSAGYLGRLVENLLEMGRLERGRVRIEATDHDLRDPVMEAAETVRPIARARNVFMKIEAPEPVRIHADRAKVVEIAVNLMENAIRYSPEGTTVLVNVQAAPPGFSVSDEGIGLGNEDPRRLFERFEQGQRSPYAGAHGFGLGLHIVSSYVQLMGGSVNAENRSVSGARFTVRLPGAPTQENS